MASACGSSTWNNWFNLFAAAFAALSLGYLTPAAGVCHFAITEEDGVLRARLIDDAPLLELPCELRGPDWGEVRKKASEREALEQRFAHLRQSNDWTNKTEHEDMQSIRDKISNLQERLDEVERANRGAAAH